MWKGVRVNIAVYRHEFAGYEVLVEILEGMYLDTDTVADLFEEYGPESHTFTITPA